MTKVPVTIPSDLSLADALERMREHEIRHLPVLDADRLAGIVSERDLAIVGGAPGVKPHKMTIGEAMRGPGFAQMSDHPFTCAPQDLLKSVTQTMLEHKFGSVVVIVDDAVVGMYTTTDALRELVSRLD
jgi:CBS domain-containing protein